MTPPITLQAGKLRLVIEPAIGAGISDFSIQGPANYFYPIMRRASAGETNASLLGSFIMAPWVNRIAHARFRFRGEEHVLRANTADGMAQHGDVRKRPWVVREATAITATLEYDSRGVADSNWPWAYTCRVVYELTSDELVIRLRVTNIDESPFPAGCGHHPYFVRRLWNDHDHLELQASVHGRYPLEHGCAVGPMAEDLLTRRFAELARVPDEHIDGVFGGFDGDAPAVLRWPASGVTLRMSASSNMGHLVVFAPHSVPGVSSPVPSIAVEPQTQVNDALNLGHRGVGGTGSVTLEPGESLDTECTMRIELGKR
jgi:aldose 1-epimerase